ncbi:MAG: metallophosphoesterase [Nitrososphaeraceae archaeon]
MYPKYIEFTVAKMIFVFCSILSFQSVITVNAQVQSDHNDFNFVAAGDWGCDKKAHETVTNMQNKSPELVLALGDLSYQKEADCWFQMMSPLINKTKMVFGDHEYNFKNSSKLDEYLQSFNLTKQYYSFDYGNVHFLAMSSEVPFDKDSKQYSFVNEDLKRASENKSINWIVAYIYEMLYTSPTFHKPTGTIRDIYHPIFDKYHVNLALQAHSHNYQRTYPIKYNDKDPSNPLISDKNEEEYTNADGTIFNVIGTAGADLHNFTGQAPYVVKQFQRFGFLDVNITSDGKVMKGTFYENRDGTDKDLFTITK